jgi:hypothetical protein
MTCCNSCSSIVPFCEMNKDFHVLERNAVLRLIEMKKGQTTPAQFITC